MNQATNTLLFQSGMQPNGDAKHAYSLGYAGKPKPHYSRKHIMRAAWYDAGAQDRHAGKPQRFTATTQ